MKHQLSKAELYKYTRMVYSYFEKHPKKVKIKKLNKMHGTYDYITEEVELDYRRELIPTIIHEVLHHYYPALSETDVLKLEKRIINQLSIRQIKNIIKQLGNVL